MGLGRKSKGEVWGRLISRDFFSPLHSLRTHLSLRFSHPQIFRFSSHKIPTKETLLLVYFGILFALSIFRRRANWLRFGFLPFLSKCTNCVSVGSVSNSCVCLLLPRKQCFLLSRNVWRVHDLRISDPRSVQDIHIWINAMDSSQPMDLKFQCIFHHFSYLILFDKYLILLLSISPEGVAGRFDATRHFVYGYLRERERERKVLGV